MMIEVCRQAAESGVSCFLYGAAEGVPELLADRLRQQIPGLQVAGSYSPPYGPLSAEQESEVIGMIEESGAGIVWVGLSTPKQERWMAEFCEKLTGPRVLFGVGAAFDINAGLIPDAPEWVGRIGLNWLFRLALEPKRLWRRYLRANPAFVWKIIRERPRLVEKASTSH
jgi:N-acetylglucosaminyldiphosphoundecaprenol N-acetyl-beta-D-mannosaminyltransferase